MASRRVPPDTSGKMCPVRRVGGNDTRACRDLTLASERVAAVSDSHAGRGIAPANVEAEGLGGDQARMSNLALADRRVKRRADGWLLTR